MRCILAVLFLTGSALCWAQSAGRLRGPVVGYLPEEGYAGIRPIRGVPGAAVAGEPMTVPEGVSRVRPAPAHRYALAEFADASAPAVLDLEGDSAPGRIAGVLARADLVAFSPTGRSAALYSSGEGRLQVVTGLPEAPKMARELAVPGAAAIAVSDDGSSVLAADAAGAVSLVDQDGMGTPLAQVERLCAMSFLPNRLDAALVDAARGEVYLAGAASRGLLATGLDGASGMAPSTDGTALHVIAAETRRAWRIDIATGESRVIELPVNPDTLEPLRPADTFLISSRAGEPAWLLTPEGTYFIPAVEKEPK